VFYRVKFSSVYVQDGGVAMNLERAPYCKLLKSNEKLLFDILSVIYIAKVKYALNDIRKI